MALDYNELTTRLRRALFAGPASGPELQRILGISQASFSRLARRVGDDLFTFGSARSTRYAWRRRVPDLPPALRVRELSDGVHPDRVLGELVLIEDDGFVFVSAVDDIETRHHDDLPWFMQDMRPAGFLGRIAGARDLLAPPDIRNWSADHVLNYLIAHGGDEPGNLVVGHPSEPVHWTRAANDAELVRLYDQSATRLMADHAIGSSAGGEQPKFATRLETQQRSVLVKFSPPLGSAIAQRVSDLLWAEHTALRVLREHGHDASLSRVLQGERTHLEVERFDRPGEHRRGVVSLWALNGAFAGTDLHSWSTTTAVLAEQGIIDAADHERVVWLEAFGHLIANSDMHPHNLSFFRRGTQVEGLAPVYDMLPMLYAPRAGELPSVAFQPPDGPAEVREAARSFWNRVQANKAISPAFRAIAAANATIIG